MNDDEWRRRGIAALLLLGVVILTAVGLVAALYALTVWVRHLRP